MKRIVLSACLILGMTVPMATPAQAIFGLSTCEKVKKKVIGYETKINEMAIFWNGYLDQTIGSPLKSRLIREVDEDSQFSEMFKLAYNNPKCFSRTQNEGIKNIRSKGYGMTNLVQYTPEFVLKKTTKCQDILQKLSPSQECIHAVKYKIKKVYSWASIYSY
jgi:hypothetical protein